jgi:hypothetical protein
MLVFDHRAYLQVLATAVPGLECIALQEGADSTTG